MTTIKDLKNLHTTVDTSSGKFLCFTKIDTDDLILLATDGYNLWKMDLSVTEIEEFSEKAGTSNDGYLGRIKSGFDDGDMKLSESNTACILTIGRGSSMLEFKLYETSAVEKKAGLHDLLFLLAEKSKDYEKDLAKANKSLDGLKQQKQLGQGATGAGGLFDLGDAKKGKTQPKAAPRQLGMSVLNPGSKKRKPAKGIDFD